MIKKQKKLATNLKVGSRKNAPTKVNNNSKMYRLTLSQSAKLVKLYSI